MADSAAVGLPPDAVPASGLPPDAVPASHAAKSWADKLGIQNAFARGTVDLAEGAVSGAATTLQHGAQLADAASGGPLVRRMIGAPDPLTEPKVQAGIQSATTAPDSVMGKVGRFGEQAAEMAIPGLKVGQAVKGASLVARMAAEGATASGVTALQTGGNPTATVTAGAAGAAAPLVGGTFSLLGKTNLPQKLYQSAIRPTWTMFKNEGSEAIAAGVKEGIPVSFAGLAQVEQRINSLGKQITDGVNFRSMQGRTVDTTKVLDTLGSLEDFYRNTAAPQQSLDILQGLRDEFTKFHGQTLSLQQAQQIKVNTYQLLKQSYGEMKSAKIEGLKQVARGLKDQIEQVFPEVADLNAQQSKMLNLDDALYRAVFRIENQPLVNSSAALVGAGGHAVMGNPGAAIGIAGKLVLDNPTIKSKLAIALARAGTRDVTGEVSKRLTALKAMLQEGGADLSSPAQSSGQLVPAPAQ